MTVALITGITGQDGSYLAERLLDEGLTAHGMVRPGDTAEVPDGVHRHQADLSGTEALRSLVLEVTPDELYHLAGVSSVARSWQEPVQTTELTGLAAAALLNAAFFAQEKAGHVIRVVQASSAEVLGDPDRFLQDEGTTINPTNPYGAAKAFAHHLVGVYRSRGLHAIGAILFNHESPRRPPSFVTRKITRSAARVAAEGGVISLVNLDARRDWGWAPDYVDALVRAARHHTALDVVIATGHTHSVREFAELALLHTGVDDPAAYLVTDPAFVRPHDAAQLVGDPTLARTELGWEPTHGFGQIIAAMVDHDQDLLL